MEQRFDQTYVHGGGAEGDFRRHDLVIIAEIEKFFAVTAPTRARSTGCGQSAAALRGRASSNIMNAVAFGHDFKYPLPQLARKKYLPGQVRALSFSFADSKISNACYAGVSARLRISEAHCW